MNYVIVITHTQMNYDSRIRRQITMLSKHYNVILACRRSSNESLESLPKNITFIQYDPNTSYIGGALLKAAFSEDNTLKEKIMNFGKEVNIDLQLLRLYEEYHSDFSYLYKTLYYYLRDHVYLVKAVLVNDVATLPMGYRLFSALRVNHPGIKLWGDMHEIHFDYSNDQRTFSQQLRVWAADTYLPRCDYISSVSDWGALQYKERYPSSNTLSIRNVSSYAQLQPSDNGNGYKLVHVGVAGKERQLDKMLSCMLLLGDRYTLDLYLVAGNKIQENYITELGEIADKLGIGDRVFFHEPVATELLSEEINKYDIGVFYLNPQIQNHVYALPNKLFEFIQGRLAVVTTPLRSMKEIIEKHEVGEVASDFTIGAFAYAIEIVRENIIHYKEKSNLAAKELNAEKEWKQFLDRVEQ